MSGPWQSFESDDDTSAAPNQVRFIVDDDDDDEQQQQQQSVAARQATTVELNIWEFVEDVAYKLLDAQDAHQALVKVLHSTSTPLRDPTRLDDTYEFGAEVRTALRQLDSAWQRELRTKDTVDNLYYKVARLHGSHPVRALYMAALTATQRHQALDAVYKPRAYRFVRDTKAATMAARAHVTLLAQYRWSELRGEFKKQPRL